MIRRMTFLGSICLGAALCLGGMAVAGSMGDMAMPDVAPSTQPTTQPFAAIDLRNTVCPVSGEKVADSNNVVVYDGKVYHLCCPDCHKDFEKDPAKFAKVVSDDPKKYGVK